MKKPDFFGYHQNFALVIFPFTKAGNGVIKPYVEKIS